MSISTKNKHNHLLMFILTLGVFGILNTEMGVVGIIPIIAETFVLRCGCGLDGQPLCADHCLLCSRRTVTFFTGKP